MYADLMLTQEQLLEEYDGSNPRRKNEIADHLADINKILEGEGDETFTDDPLIDKWEAELAEGRIPDLSEGEDEDDA